MNALDKNVAVARGEALASSLLASLAIQTILVMVANREEFLTKMETFIDVTLNLSGPGKGDASDELHTLIRIGKGRIGGFMETSSSGRAPAACSEAARTEAP
jgi:hypothetical protein